MAKKQKPYTATGKSANTGNTDKPVDRASSIDVITRIDKWLSARKNWLAAGIFIVSGLLNTIFFQQAKDTPLKSMHKWESSDMAFFDLSARRIAGGDWLCDTVLHPYHEWHDTYAKGYFEQYPETATFYYNRHLNAAGVADTVAARRDMINTMFQGKVYHQEPLYVYLVAITYRLFGTDPNWVYLWQLLLGALTSALVFWVGMRYFGALAGLLAALVVMTCGPAVVYDMTILRTTLTAFLSFLLLLSYQKMLDEQSLKSRLLFGVVAGIGLLAQSYFLLFLLPALAWYVWVSRQDLKKAAIGLGVVLGALLLTMSPLFIRNMKVGVPMTAMASNGAVTYILFNSSNAQPLEPSYMHFPSTVKLMHDSDGKLASAAIACLKSFENVGDLLTLYKKKINGLFMWYEIPNNMSYYMYKEFSPLLKALPAPYRFIAPLGICGLFFGFWRLRWRFLPVFLMILASSSPLFISASLARYRVPFVMLMCLLAAFFVVELIRNLLQANWKTAAAGVLLAGLAWYYTDNIRDQRFFVFYPSDIMPVYFLHYRDRLMELEKAKKDKEYLALTTELMRYLPDYFLTVRSSHSAFSSNEGICCSSVANLLKMHASILKQNGMESESARYTEQVAVLNTIADNLNKRLGR